MELDSHFVPYSKPIEISPVPKSISQLNTAPSGLINGARTTFRRKFGNQVGWTETLRYYAIHDDTDFSYRMASHGRLILAADAGFFHADGADRKINRFRLNTIRIRNLLALHVVHSPSRICSTGRCIASFGKFALLYVLIDAAQLRFSLPTARAYLYGILQTPVFLFWPFRNFEQWYKELQEKMFRGVY